MLQWSVSARPPPIVVTGYLESAITRPDRPPDRRGGGRSYASQMALRWLIVDDSAGFLEAARALLEREGVSVVAVASTGEEALARVETLRPDVTLIDIDLGGESGFAVTRRLADDIGVDTRSLILISTDAREEFADLIESSPAAGFVSKSDLRRTRSVRCWSGNGSIGSGPSSETG